MNKIFIKYLLISYYYYNFASLEPPSLLTMLKSGVVLFIPLDMSILFDKDFMQPADMVELLHERGLQIDNHHATSQYLQNIGYYRLSAYMYPFLTMPKDRHRFKHGSKFKDVLNIYRFDKKLRLFLFNEIEKIEIALRSTIANLMAKETSNIFWMTDKRYFANTNKFERTLELIDRELRNSKEEFILHFKEKYCNPYPPAWILVEILPLGILTRIFENLRDNTLRKKIALHFGLSIPVFSSWITIITLTRNACCHHSRVWNKENAISPMVPKKLIGKWISSVNSVKRVYYNICIIKWFINIISPNNDMLEHLMCLLEEFSMIDINAMGFPNGNWWEEPLWHSQS